MRIMLLATLLATAAPLAAKQQEPVNPWQVGLDYIHLTNQDTTADAKLPAIAASLGYQFRLSPKISLTPEISLGKGVNEDRLSGLMSDDGITPLENVRMELIRYLSASLKLGYDLSPDMAVFIAPTLSQQKLRIWGNMGCPENVVCVTAISPFEVTEDDWSTGATLGGQFRLTSNLGLEASYSHHSDSKLFNAGIRYRF